MEIISFKNINFTILKDINETERNIGYTTLKNCYLTGRNLYYPNILIYSSNNILINPYDEKIMSLNKDTFYDNNIYEDTIKNTINIDNKLNIINEECFFFIYNFDNYYHYLYDTLPYLYTYLEIKKNTPNIKLLIQYPNKYKKDFYRFNEELLFKIVNKKDIIIHDENNLYNKIYISTSLTHGGFSNNPPRKEIYKIYNIIKNNIVYENINEKYKNINEYKNIYISRRTWLNNDTSNIGTDYTSRRKMINETDLVNKLEKYGFKEIFSENLNTDEKIYLFLNSEKIIGSIGGGMANLLFSPTNTKSYIIVSPYFLEVNYRFKYSMEHTDIKYFNETEVYKENNNIPLYCRVKIINTNNNYYNKIGEIINYEKSIDKYKISISNNDVVGFNNKNSFNDIYFKENEFELLDKGLNSPYLYDNKKLINKLY